MDTTPPGDTPCVPVNEGLFHVRFVRRTATVGVGTGVSSAETTADASAQPWGPATATVSTEICSEQPMSLGAAGDVATFLIQQAVDEAVAFFRVDRTRTRFTAPKVTGPGVYSWSVLYDAQEGELRPGAVLAVPRTMTMQLIAGLVSIVRVNAPGKC